MPPKQDNPDDLRVILANARDGALELVDSVVKLAQVEVRRDAKQMFRLAAQAIACMALLIAGYCFVVVATAWGLAAWFPAWVVLLALGGIHFVAGVWAAKRLRQRAQQLSPLQLTAVELTKAVASLRGSFSDQSSSSLVAVPSHAGSPPVTRL